MSERTKQLDELLRQEIAEIVTREVGDPRIGFVTITDVETSPDLRHAQVWVSVIGQPAERDATIAALGRAMPFVRRELGRRLRLKRIPDLHVRLDDTAERGTRVLRSCMSSRRVRTSSRTCRSASPCRHRSRGCPTRATSRTSRRPPRSRPSRRRVAASRTT